VQIAREPSSLSALLDGFRSAGRRLGFVPTMGALHDGHLSLIDKARAHSDVVVVSIFVNPTQFGPNEDYLKYPRPETKDLQLLTDRNVDVAYLPSVAVMYPSDASVTVDPGPVGSEFEGRFRPDHFRGVLTVVAKLFHQVRPTVAVFGSKDAQQLFLIRQMVRDLNFAIEIIEGETVREADGLALSSRNAYLKAAERSQATRLYRALSVARTAFKSGVRSLEQLKEAMIDSIAQDRVVSVDYITAVSRDTFVEIDPVPDESLLIGAVRIGSVRLIDNLVLKAA
jgi:pantoate--beta-alanine ligase